MFLLQTTKWDWGLNRVVGILRLQSIVFQVGELQCCGKRPQCVIFNKENTHRPRLTSWRETATFPCKQTPRVLNQLDYTNKKRKYSTMSASSFPYRVQLHCAEQNKRVTSMARTAKPGTQQNRRKKKLKTVNQWVIKPNSAACCNAGVTHTHICPAAFRWLRLNRRQHRSVSKKIKKKTVEKSIFGFNTGVLFLLQWYFISTLNAELYATIG